MANKNNQDFHCVAGWVLLQTMCIFVKFVAISPQLNQWELRTKNDLALNLRE